MKNDLLIGQEINRCMICYEAPCASSCPFDMKPDKLLRSIRFKNELGAQMRLFDQFSCAQCDAPCEKACNQKENPIRIKRVLTEKYDEAENFEEFESVTPNLSCDFCGVKLENPFLLSSSVVASSYEKIARAFDMGWAGACYKTMCCFIPREASPRYSVTSGENGFYGFKNIEQLSCNGIENDLEIIRRLKKDYPTKVIIASIMGRNEEEWEQLARDVQEAGADIVECNFSCPNMEQEGLGVDIGQDTEAVKRFTAAAWRGCSIPLMAKMTPNVADMRPSAIAAVQGGADAIAAINTVKSLMDMNLDTYATQPSVRGYSGVGGYSGDAVKPIALRFIWEMASAPELSGIPISGMGGITTWRDAVEFMLLGANHVQITTSVMQYGARIIDDLIEGLTLYLKEKSQTRVADLIGLGLDNVKALDHLERNSVLYPRLMKQRCVGCGRCYLSCRDGGHDAIQMKDGKPIINAKHCVGCHLCVLVCPVNAIVGYGHRVPKRFEG